MYLNLIGLQNMKARRSLCSLSHGRSRFLSSLTSRQIHRQIQVCATITLLTLLGLPGRSQQIPDLTQKSLEDLMSIEVTSVSKKEQKTSEAAAAVFVISREDIRRSGALNTYTFPPAVLARAAQLLLAESGCP